MNLVQNVGERPVRGVWGTEVRQVQGRGPGRGSGGLRPPEAEAILDFYMDNFHLILNYFPPPLQILGDVSPRQGLRLCSLIFINYTAR